MTDPMNDPFRQVPMNACQKCGEQHDPARCKGHAKNSGGKQCQLPPMTGQLVCRVHGGSTRASKAAAEARTFEKKVRETLGALDIVPVENPLLELQMLAGEARAWKVQMAERVANLTSLRYSTDGGEALRGEVLLFERAMDRCAHVLALIAKLNIDARLAAIAENQAATVLAAIELALASAGVAGPAAIEARLTAARHLRSVA